MCTFIRPPDIVVSGLRLYRDFFFLSFFYLFSSATHWSELNQKRPHARNAVLFENACPKFGVFFPYEPGAPNPPFWLTMLVMTTMWSTGLLQQYWTGNLTGAPGGSRRRYIFERDGVQWTGMRAATHWAIHTTEFLPCHITAVARTGRTEQASSDKDLWYRSKRQGKNMSGWDMN